ncbi:MAG: KpsF/GutQ family sugar-phosphate isomerase [Alphaproteobacteria bacterium]
MSYIESAKRILNLEAQAITALSETIDTDFSAAIEIIKKTTGRVVVTGMGKSGHIGNKIAATLASTGTPSFYVHPAEAIHGDLGMISKEDVVLALSNSGETEELFGIISYVTRFSIPMIGITKKKESTLGKASTVVLALPPIEEACPLNMAPTTSTTMTLALGDAIAITLLNEKGFSKEDFSVFHPGGKLGKKLLRVSDIMIKDEVPLVDEKASISDAIFAMTGKRSGSVGVLNSAKTLIGIITDGDLRRHISNDLLAKKITEVMTRDPITIAPDALVTEAIAQMNKKNITCLFVVDAEKNPLGIIYLKECLAAGVV